MKKLLMILVMVSWCSTSMGFVYNPDKYLLPGELFEIRDCYYPITTKGEHAVQTYRVDLESGTVDISMTSEVTMAEAEHDLFPPPASSK